MLETAAERVRLLKLGMSGKKIEQLYIYYNGFAIDNRNVLKTQISKNEGSHE